MTAKHAGEHHMNETRQAALQDWMCVCLLTHVPSLLTSLTGAGGYAVLGSTSIPSARPSQGLWNV